MSWQINKASLGERLRPYVENEIVKEIVRIKRGEGTNMREAIKYSIIIPVYNAEKTLDRCLNSILLQKRTDIQIIAVNDGSTDHSQEILDAFAAKYRCLTSVFQNNSGVSHARNTGLEAVQGTYVLFVDSDDFVSESYFDKLDIFDDADLCVFATHIIGSKNSDNDFFAELSRCGSFSEIIKTTMAWERMYSLWNKRFKREIIENHRVRFQEHFQIGEDFDFCMNYALWCSTVSVSDKVLYHVDVSDGNSLSRKYRPDLNKKLRAVYLHIREMFEDRKEADINNDNVLAALDFLFARSVFSCIAEEFKTEKPHYFRDKKKYAAICSDFTDSIGPKGVYANAAHRVIRLLLRLRCFFILYLITYIVKIKWVISR